MARKFGSRRGGAIWVWVRAALFVAAAFGTAASFLPFLGTEAWWVRFLSFPRVEILAALSLVFLLMLVLPRRFRPVWIAGGVVALAGISAQCWVLYPWLGWPPVEMPAAASCPDGHGLRVLEANVRMTNENGDRLLSIVRKANPDVALFEETDQWWSQKLDALDAAYPYREHEVTQNYYGIELFSRYPLEGAEIRHLTSSRDPSVFAGVRLPSGDLVRFYGIHPRPPEEGQSAAERDGQILSAALTIRKDGAPSVVAGDLNSTPWSRVVRRAERIGNLGDPRIGRGWMPTFRTHSAVMTWPLDQVLAGDAFTVRGMEVLPPFGSDHRPILAGLCLDASAAGRQAAPALRPGDIRAARATIAEAQNEAAPSPEPKPSKQEPGGSG